jgi:O-antigen/teichoic acid export membrane protein
MMGYGVLVVACFVPIFDTFTNFSAYFLGKADFRGNIIANIFVQVGATLTLVVSLLYVKNILFILFAYFGSYSVLYYICYQYVLKQIPENAQEDPGTLPYGKHLSLMSVLSVVASNIDKILLFHLLGPSEVAIYTITTSAPDQLKSVLGFLTTLFFPQFAKKSESDIRAVMRHTFFLFFITSAVGITIYIALAPWFFHVFFRQYEHYILLSQIFAVSLLTISFDPALIYLNSHGRIREQYWSTTIGNVMQIIAIVALAIPFGLWGVIIARVVVRFLSNLLNVFFYYYPLTTTTSL